MSRSDRKALLRSRFAVMHGAILAARFLTPSAHVEALVTLTPVPAPHSADTLTSAERVTLAGDILSAKLAQDSRAWNVGRNRGDGTHYASISTARGWIRTQRSGAR